MAFCRNCGEQLNAGVRFCHVCGKPVEDATASGYTKREQEYAGKIIKCPNCGESMTAFQVYCPTCGHEIRETHASSVVREFAAKLEAIDKEPEPKLRSLLRKVSNQNELSEKEKRKVSLIKSFPIPNTREDLFEFLIMASANVDQEHVELSVAQQAISDAWKAKYEQAYQKAMLSFPNSSEFHSISGSYNEKKKKHERSKFFAKVGIVAMMVVLGAFGVGGLIIGNIKEDQKFESENARMQALVDEAYDYLAQGDYARARAAASKIVFAGSSLSYQVEAAERWDGIREELLNTIDQAEGVEIEHPPQSQASEESNEVDSREKTETAAAQSSDIVNDIFDGMMAGFDATVKSINAIDAF